MDFPVPGVFLADHLVHEAVRDLDLLRGVDPEPPEEVVLRGVLLDGRLAVDLDVDGAAEVVEVVDGLVGLSTGLVRAVSLFVVAPVAGATLL
jgi:hypothetical protein